LTIFLTRIEKYGIIQDKQISVNKRKGEGTMKEYSCFDTTEILLPDFGRTDGKKWATVACDQYTSEPHYWREVEETVGDAPSTLRLMLPEVWLSESESRTPAIHRAMEDALADTLHEYPDAMIYLERTQSDGLVRRGLIGAVDLECYDYNKGSTSLIRATEGTVLERIPPRVAVRRGAPLEMPHVMLLIDDPRRTVIEEIGATCADQMPIYDFDLMQNGGHVRGYLVDKEQADCAKKALSALVTPTEMENRYGSSKLDPLLFAVGDGNHSLASAKAAYEEIKAHIGEEDALIHPARHALCEVVNLHDDALGFEPIYRVVFGADPDVLLSELKTYIQSLEGSAEKQTLTAVVGNRETVLTVPHPVQQLTVGTLQAFLDSYLATHEGVTVDYIHGEDSLRALAVDGAVGFLFDGMKKDELFKTVLFDGALPRKTFSMGHASDKRYYLECRRIG
jgi:hypothetical protein